MKNILLAVFTLVAAVAFSQNNREKILLDDDWKFHLGNSSDPSKDFDYGITNIFSKAGEAGNTAFAPGFNGAGWRTVQIPHDWVVELPFANEKSNDQAAHGYKAIGANFPQNNIGWYRKTFELNAKDSGNKFYVQFDGVYRNCKVFLNGHYLGGNESGYIGFELDITDYLNFHKENVIAVRVDASQYEGWFYEGAGIYRHVWLKKMNPLHITSDGVFVQTKQTGSNASVSVKNKIINEKYSADAVSVQNYILDKAGNKIGISTGQKISLSVNETKTINQTINIGNAHLWGIDDPYLYRLVSLVKQNGKTIDSITTKFGVRTVTVDVDKGLFINGKPVKIQGTCNHQDHAGVGSAVPDALNYYRIKLLKEMGVNAYRTSHNPPTPELLDACDELGMIVLDENRLLGSSTEYMSQFERLIKRDRNHPSVFMWSIANEEHSLQWTDVAKRIAATLVAKQKELDPSRTCTYAANMGGSKRVGILESIPVRGFNYFLDAWDEYRRENPRQPIMGSEMGSTVCTRGIYTKDKEIGYVPDYDSTYPGWASTAEHWWKMAAERPWFMGGFVWTGFDYRGEPTPYGWPCINSHFGIMDVCGFPKNLYYYYQSWWTNKDVLHIYPHWNWKGKEGQPVEVWCNSNADNVELFLNGKSLGKKDMPHNGHLVWEVNYEPGTLEAVGYKNGRRLTTKVETTGAPAEVVLTPYKTTMLADGRDVSVINISIVDSQGREVPDANNLVKFTITGPAKIIGVGNGKPSSHEPDKCEDSAWQRSAFNGKLQVIVQSTRRAGFVKFEAKADGLWTGSTDIVTVSPANVANVSVDKNYELKGEAAKPRHATKMLGADISFLSQLEDRGIKYSDNGIVKDAVQILKDHGFNYVRLRVFDDPARDSGYSPQKGFCDLNHTKQMAKRVKDAGMKLLLDFHYSDYWADPGKQYKPAAWRGLNFQQLKQALYDYTKKVMNELKAQGTLPDMVQVGNEINHGVVWPEGSIENVDFTAQLLSAGIAAVKSVEPSTVIMLHVALGGQNDESTFFFDNMVARKVQFDVIGLSYYPKWHGTLDDLRGNIDNLGKRYNKDVIVVEYSSKKEEVNQIAFSAEHGKGTCIWEPLSTWESFFDKDGKSNHYLEMYDELSKRYLK